MWRDLSHAGVFSSWLQGASEKCSGKSINQNEKEVCYKLLQALASTHLLHIWILCKRLLWYWEPFFFIEGQCGPYDQNLWSWSWTTLPLVFNGPLQSIGCSICHLKLFILSSCNFLWTFCSLISDRILTLDTCFYKNKISNSKDLLSNHCPIVQGPESNSNLISRWISSDID